MKPQLILITGISNSGKDTLGQVFKASGMVQYAMNRPMKQAIEAMYDLPKGAMEDEDYRKMYIDFKQKERGTFLDLMVRLAEIWRQADPECMISLAKNYLIRQQRHTYVSGVRFPDEVDALHSLNHIYDIRAYELRREGEWSLASDREVDATTERIKALDIPFKPICNNGTIDQLWEQAQVELDQIFSIKNT